MNHSMQFNIIGAGRLGSSLAYALINRARWQLLTLCNQHLSSAQQTVERLKSGSAVATIVELSSAPITFIATPDDHIAEVAKTLANNPFLKPGDVVVHCSGVYSSSLLQPLSDRGCYVASIHPFKAFKTAMTDSDLFQDCDCVIEGDANALTLLSTLFGQLGAKVISLNTEKKQLYHAAATMASNYLVSLASIATSLLVEAGIEASLAKQMCERLMESNLQNIRASASAEQALTGPLLRGDIQTILLHLGAIKNPLIGDLYRAAGLATLPLTNNSDERLMTLSSLLES